MIKKRTFLSVILGIFSLSYLLFMGGPIGEKLAEKEKLFGMDYVGFFGILFGIIGFLGLIFGILGIKSPKKKLAILGIILSLIGLLIIGGFNLLVYVLGPHTF